MSVSGGRRYGSGTGRTGRSGGSKDRAGTGGGRRRPEKARSVRTGRLVTTSRPAGGASARGGSRSRGGRGGKSRPPRRWPRLVLPLLLVAAALGLGGFSTVKSLVLAQLVDIVVAREGRLEETLSGEGFIIRQETILRSPVTGTVLLTLTEGARARKDAEVANLSDTEERQEAETKVARLDADLAAYNAGHAAEEEELTAGLAATRAELRRQAEALRQACLVADAEAMDAAATALAELEIKQREAESRLADIHRDRAALEESLATARLALNQSVFPVLAPHPGLVSYTLDGLEDILTLESIGDYGTRQMLTMMGNLGAIENQARLSAGAPVAKIISDSGAYVSVIVTNDEAGQILDDSQVILRFDAFAGRRETRARLYHVGEREKNGYCLVTYAAEELLDGMVGVRQVTTTIVLRTHVGTIIPRQALVHRGGQDGVFVLEGGVCRFRPVTVEGGDQDELVVDGLSPGTPVIRNPSLVDEGTDLGQAGDARRWAWRPEEVVA